MAEWLPLAISGLALATSVAFGVFTLLDRRLNIRVSRQSELYGWIGEVREAYAALMAADPAGRPQVLHRLRVLLDFGRLHFPNDSRGYRSHVLDPLVETWGRCVEGDHDVARIQKDWRVFIDCLNAHTMPFRVESSPESRNELQYKNRDE